MKLLQRAPREVYRVYDEEEFLADSAQELTAPPHGRGVSLLVAGAFVLAIATASLLAELLASHQRLHGRTEARRVEGTPSTASVAAVLRRVQSLRPPHRQLSTGNRTAEVHRVSAAPQVRRGRVVVVQVNAMGGSISVERRGYLPAPTEVAPPTVVASGAAPEPPEFGFER